MAGGEDSYLAGGPLDGTGGGGTRVLAGALQTHQGTGASTVRLTRLLKKYHL